MVVSGVVRVLLKNIVHDDDRIVQLVVVSEVIQIQIQMMYRVINLLVLELLLVKRKITDNSDARIISDMKTVTSRDSM